jgi:multiple sugar transport system permease protein
MRRSSAGVTPYLFLLPAALMFTLFLLLPIGYAVWLSTRGVRVSGLGFGAGARREVAVGLANYRAAMADPELWRGSLRVLVYGVIVLPTMLGLALVFALLLDSTVTRFTRFSRIAIFLPYAVPIVIAALMWGFLYLPGVSPIHHLTRNLGLPDPDFLTPTTVFGSLANIAVWGGVGFNMLVLYTALRAVPRELYDAARVDGCSELQLALRVKIPLLLPAIILTAVFSLIATVQVFSEPTTLRPIASVISTSWTPLMKVYRDAFIQGDLYSAAATSVLIALAALVLSFGFLRVVQSRAFGEDR